MQLLVVIEGPTASGKTALSVEVAKYFNTIILSADSRQCYREMSIGTAKPSMDEMGNVKHYFISSHSIKNELTAATFAFQANEILDREFKDHSIIVLTGGSGLYMDALCKGLDEVPVSPAHRIQLNAEYRNSGIEALLYELKITDPEHYSIIDQSNPMRIIRALEVIRSTGKRYSSFLKKDLADKRFEVLRFRIEHPRDELYFRINQRVDKMINEGLVDEVRSLLLLRDLNPLKTVGYREIFDYFDGKTDLNTAVELIKQHTRNYAKRQLTWLRRNSESITLAYSSIEEMKSLVLRQVKDKLNIV